VGLGLGYSFRFSRNLALDVAATWMSSFATVYRNPNSAYDFELKANPLFGRIGILYALF